MKVLTFVIYVEVFRQGFKENSQRREKTLSPSMYPFAPQSCSSSFLKCRRGGRRYGSSFATMRERSRDSQHPQLKISEPIHLDVQQKPTQYCKSIIPQLKINNFLKISEPKLTSTQYPRISSFTRKMNSYYVRTIVIWVFSYLWLKSKLESVTDYWRDNMVQRYRGIILTHRAQGSDSDPSPTSVITVCNLCQ